MHNDDKKTLRSRMRDMRKGLTPNEITSRSQAVCRRISQLAPWIEAREVLAYMAKGGEVDVTPLLTELWERGVRVLLPRCRPGERGIMDLACPTGIHEVAPGAFGIPEPVPDACPAVESCAPDLVIVPGVAFDRTGKRLGMGGGYYDRMLASGELGKPLLVAPAFSFQIVSGVPTDPWDRPVDVIVTEEETLWP